LVDRNQVIDENVYHAHGIVGQDLHLHDI
jgi:hypothetical protein